MSYYSRRQLEALGEPLGEDATRVKPGGHGRIYGMGGGGGGGNTTSTGTTYNTNIPEYAQPYVETMLGATQKQLFDMSGNDITGFKPYKPYSTNASDYVAPFSPMQEQAMRTAASPEAFGREVTGYMSPYMQNVVDIQKREAMRGAGIMGAQQQAQASNAGAFGGYREGIQRAENARNLGTQMNDIQLKGQQMAFDEAQKQARASQQLQMQYGQMQQSQEQQKINQSIQDYANAQQYPLMQLGVMSNMLRGLPMQAATTNQYVAAPNPITQGIGVAGAGASIYNALKAKGGVIKEYAGGGITSIDDGSNSRDPNDRPGIREYMEAQNAQNATRFDVGGEVESQLEMMDAQELMRQAQESSSPTVRRMAQRILRERQMEQGAPQSAPQSVGPTGPMGISYEAPQMAKGGIIAFQSGEEVEDPYKLARQGEGEDIGGSTFHISRGVDGVDRYVVNNTAMPNKAAFDTMRALALETGATPKPFVYDRSAPDKGVTSAVVTSPLPEGKKLEGIDAVPVVAAAPVAVPATDRARGIVVAEPPPPVKAARDTLTAETGIKDPTLNPPAVVGRALESDRSRGIVVAEPPPPVKAARDTSTPGNAGTAVVAAPVAAPAAAEEKMPVFTGPLAEIEKAVWEARQDAKRSEADYLKQIKEGIPENTAAAEYRKQVMEERANAKDEAQRQRYMRMAQFFAKWGSTPGPTLAAGLNALDKSLPDIISDEQGYKKAKRELDKVIYDIDNATRLEELGYKKDARALKEKAADRAKDLQHYLTMAQAQIKSHEISAEASVKGHQISAEATKAAAVENRKGHEATARAMQASRDEQNATKVQQLFTSAVANRQHEEANIANEMKDPAYVAAKKTLSYTPKTMTPALRQQRQEAQALVTEREGNWATRRKEAADFVDLYRKQALPVFEKRTPDTGKSKEAPAEAAPAPAAPPKPAAIPPKPANYPDAQWSEKENAYVIPRKGRGGVTNWVKLVPTE